MSEKYNSLTVVLESDCHEDFVKELCKAIRLMKGVYEVSATPESSYANYIAKMQVKNELRDKVWELFQ